MHSAKEKGTAKFLSVKSMFSIFEEIISYIDPKLSFNSEPLIPFSRTLSGDVCNIIITGSKHNMLFKNKLYHVITKEA